jgi:hypothetical protein
MTKVWETPPYMETKSGADSEKKTNENIIPHFTLNFAEI